MASRTKRDYYEVLGIAKNATDEQIKKAFRTLAKKYHPDANNDGDEKQFKEISEAYETLSNPEKRRQYDQFGAEGITAQGFSGFNAGGFSDISSAFFGDVFSDLFGGGRKEQHRSSHYKTTGDNIVTNIEINMRDVFFGKKMTISINVDVACEVCKQTGAKSTSDIVTCSKCKGRGQLDYVQQTPLGMFHHQQTCDYCGGVGKSIKQKCWNCKGHGYYIQNQKLEFEIPRSIHDRQQIRIKGKGKISPNGVAQGDLFIIINIKRHPFIERHGNDIYLKLPVSYLDVILGNVIIIPTFEGLIKEKLPLGLQNGEKITIKNQGFFTSTTKRGDLHIIIDVQFPTKITKSEQERLWSINNETKFDPNGDFANNAIKRI